MSILHPGHINISPPDIIHGKINRLLLNFWPYEITEDKIRIWNVILLIVLVTKDNLIAFVKGYLCQK